jgi:uncharacterized protein YbbC (DUF1343 family)
MLDGLDSLVIDLQDIGTRSYTFISCMRYAVEACFEQGVEVVVLDRPNPLGGQKADGPLMDEAWMSYVGAFRVPYVHGLTIGELALAAQQINGWLNISEEDQTRGKLTVVPMRGWRRDYRWPATGLDFRATSPYIPDLSAVLGYPMTGLGGQLGGFSHGIGTPHPFRLLRHRQRSNGAVKAALERKGIPGLAFHELTTHTQNAARRPVRGVYVEVTGWARLRPTELSFYLMALSADWDGDPFNAASQAEQDLFNKHVGSDEWWAELTARGPDARVEMFVSRWARQADFFHKRSRRFWLYR